MGESQTQGRNRIQLSVTDIQKGSCYVDFGYGLLMTDG
jgi:hypothetical protein